MTDLIEAIRQRPTPETDAAAERGSDLGIANTWISGIWPLARSLEQRLAAATEALRSIAGLQVPIDGHLGSPQEHVNWMRELAHETLSALARMKEEK